MNMPSGSQESEIEQEQMEKLFNTLVDLEPDIYRLALWSAEFNEEPFPKALRRIITARDKILLNRIYGRSSFRITGLTPQDKII